MDEDLMDKNTMDTLDTVAVRSFSMLAKFKREKQIWIKWHSQILKNSKINTDATLRLLEVQLGINLFKWLNYH